MKEVRAQRIKESGRLDQVIEAYRKQPHTPELVTAFYAAFLGERAQEAGIDIIIPPFPGTQEELKKREEAGDMVVYIPEKQDILNLFSSPVFYVLKNNGSRYNDSVEHTGWGYTEAQITTPFPGTNENQLTEKIEKAGREGLTIFDYFMAGQVSKQITGKYLDEDGGWVRLTASSEIKYTLSGPRPFVVLARFSHNGAFHVDHGIMKGGQSSMLGGRSFLKA